MARTAVATPRSAARTWWLDALVLAVGAAVLRLPAFVADRHLTYDDGVFGSSALLLREGAVPYRDVFSPQGPLFLPLVWVADLVGLRSANGLRILPLASGIAVTLATYAAGRYVTGRAGALLAGGLVATSGSVLWTTSAVASDGPAMALATTAVALAFGYRVAPSSARAAAVGACLGAALMVKPLVLPAAIPVGVLLLGRRRRGDVVVAVGTALVIGLAVTAPWGFGRVWDQTIAYHRESARIASHLGAARKLVVTLFERDTLVMAGALLALGGVAWRRRETTGGKGDDGGVVPARTAAALLGAWALAVAAFLVLEPAFWRPQLAHLVPPLALLVGLRPPPARLLVLAAVVALPWQVAHVRPVLWPQSYDADERAAVDALGSLPSDARVITDEPGLAWRANRLVPGDLVDASIKRIEQGQITADVLVDAAANADVCAVLVWSSRYADLDGLAEGLRNEGYTITERFEEARVLYARERCDPG